MMQRQTGENHIKGLRFKGNRSRITVLHLDSGSDTLHRGVAPQNVGALLPRMIFPDINPNRLAAREAPGRLYQNKTVAAAYVEDFLITAPGDCLQHLLTGLQPALATGN